MKFSILVLAIFLVGCASTARNLDYVSVGMSRQSVIYVMGEPAETRTSAGTEYLIYKLRSAPSAEAQAGCGAAGVATLGMAYMLKGCRYSDDDYFIELKQGTVTAYGRLGSLGPAQNPEAATGGSTTLQK